MRIDVQTKDEQGNITFNASLTRAEVNTLLQYAVNNLMGMGYVYAHEDLSDDDDTTNRFRGPNQQGKKLN